MVETAFFKGEQTLPIAKHNAIFFMGKWSTTMNQGVNLLTLRGQLNDSYRRNAAGEFWFFSKHSA